MSCSYSVVALMLVGVLAANSMGQARLESKADLQIGETVTETSKNIWVVFQDKSNHVWFGSDGEGVYRYDGQAITHFSTRDGLCSNRIREIQQDKSGSLYFTTLDGISKFDGKRFATLPVVISTAANKGWSLQADDMWFKGPGKNGPYRYDGIALYDLRFPKLAREDEHNRRFPNTPYSPYEIYTIYKDRRGSVWFGTSNFGLCRFDGENLSWMYEEHLTQIEGGGSFGIRSILEDRDSKFWICNSRYRFAVDTKPSSKGKELLEYKREPGIAGLLAPDGTDHIYFQSIVEDDQHDLWMAAYRFGVFRYDGKSVTHYPVKDGDQVLGVISIYKDNTGDLWLGTQEAGAYKFNGKAFERFRP